MIERARAYCCGGRHLEGLRLVLLLSVAGKKAGDRTEFDDPFRINATLQPAP